MSAGSTRIRVLAVGIALVMLIPLGVARTLSPAKSGLGTHQQLGLPPCSMRVFFDIRCPACGMTTSWSHWTRGQWLAAGRANTGGACLAFLVVAVALIAVRAAWTGRSPLPTTITYLGWAVVSVGAVTVVDWLVRLSR